MCALYQGLGWSFWLFLVCVVNVVELTMRLGFCIVCVGNVIGIVLEVRFEFLVVPNMCRKIV